MSLSRSCQKLYLTYNKAFEVYKKMKKSLIQILRNLRDKAHFKCIGGASSSLFGNFYIVVVICIGRQ